MKEITSRSSLAIVLSQLKGFQKPKVRDEQYTTSPEIAADLLWTMHMRNELDGKAVADLGSGTGILGLGALLMGARKVFLVDKDRSAMETAKQNYAVLKDAGYMLGDAAFELRDISDFNENVDVVVENPPFGTRNEHADRDFLGKAFSLADTVWSFHKTSTERFVHVFAEDNGFRVAEKMQFSFPLHAVHSYHTRKMHRIEATLFRLEK